MPKPPNIPDPYQWTLSLPPGQHCSVGFSNNMMVSVDGIPSPGGRANEDKFFTCSSHDNQIQVYLVLDGHDGLKACEFVRKHLPTVFLENSIRDERSLLESLRAAFLATEREFFVQIDPYLTQKMTLQFNIDQKSLNSAEAYRLFPSQVAEIQRMDEEIKGGTTAVMAVVYKNKLYIANCGDSRAVLCSEEASGKMTVRQVSVDHNTQNEKELQRLAEVGLDPHTLRRSKRLGTQQNTRSIGDHSIKGGYRDIDTIAHAKQEPGTAEPYIASPIDLTGFRGFLLLMTDGLYEAYEAWTHRPAMVNEDIAHLVAKEIKQMTEFHFVAQKVVEKVKNVFQQSCKSEKQIGRLDDITLIIRNFGYPHLTHSHSYPDMAPEHFAPQNVSSTAPVIPGASQANNMFFPTTSAQNLSYYSNVPHQANPYTEFSTTTTPSLPVSMLGGVSSASGYTNPQQPFPNNAQSFRDSETVSMGGGGFFPEPTGYTNTGARPGPGYTQTNDWYHPSPQNSTQSLSYHSQPPFSTSASYADRHHSVPVVATPYGDNPHNYPYSTSQWGTNPSQVPTTSTSDHRWRQDYINTNPLGTDQLQNERSSSRSSVYENVQLQSQNTLGANQPDSPDKQLEERAQALTLKEKKSPSTVMKQSSPQASTATPPSGRKTPVPTTEASKEQTTPKQARHDSSAEDFEMYGWTMDDTPPGSRTDVNKDQYDTLKEEDIKASTPIAEPAFSSKVEARVETTPASQGIPTTLSLDEDEETMIVNLTEEGDVETELSDHESVEVDGEIRACVKFSTNFPDISWDDIEV